MVMQKTAGHLSTIHEVFTHNSRIINATRIRSRDLIDRFTHPALIVVFEATLPSAAAAAPRSNPYVYIRLPESSRLYLGRTVGLHEQILSSYISVKFIVKIHNCGPSPELRLSPNNWRSFSALPSISIHIFYMSTVCDAIPMSVSSFLYAI